MDSLEIFGNQNERGTPERNLLMAVLERAILDYVGNDEREIADAEEWLFDDIEARNLDKISQNEGETHDYQKNSSESPLLSPFTFDWVCQQLDLDSKFVSNTIKAMPKRGNKRVAPWYFDKAPLNKDKCQPISKGLSSSKRSTDAPKEKKSA